MDTLSYVSRMLPARSLLEIAADWILGTEPPREMRGQLIDGARLYRGEALERAEPGLARIAFPVQGVRPASLYLVRHDGPVVAFDAAGSRRLAEFQAANRGVLDVVVRACKKLDGSYKLVRVAAEEAPSRAVEAGEREPLATTITIRSAPRARIRRPVQVPSQLRQ